jgi:hypothetical protein
MYVCMFMYAWIHNITRVTRLELFALTVCMYVCIYVCSCIRTHTHMHAYIQGRTHQLRINCASGHDRRHSIHTYTHACMHTYIQGRTHQLRIHCASGLGMPMIGDTAYMGLDLGCGLLLAAEGISFMHPSTNQSVNFSLGEPGRFSKFWEDEGRAFEGLQFSGGGLNLSRSSAVNESVVSLSLRRSAASVTRDSQEEGDSDDEEVSHS